MFGRNVEAPRQEDPIQVAIQEVGKLIRNHVDEDEQMVDILDTFDKGNHLEAFYKFEMYVEGWEESDVKTGVRNRISTLRDDLGIEE